MMERVIKNSRALVGMLFFLSMGGVGYFTIVRANVKTISGASYLPVIFSTAEHLRVGSPVNVLGVSAGVIGSLHYIMVDDAGNHFIPERGGLAGRSVRSQYVLAVLDLTQPVELHDDYKIFALYPTIISQKTVEINPGRRVGEDRHKYRSFTLHEAMALRNRGVVPSEEGRRIALALNSDDPLYIVAEVVSENRGPLRRITSSLAMIAEKINRGEGDLSRVLNRPDLYRNAVTVLAATTPLIEDGRNAIEDLRETRQPVDAIKVLLSIGLAVAKAAAAPSTALFPLP